MLELLNLGEDMMNNSFSSDRKLYMYLGAKGIRLVFKIT